MRVMHLAIKCKSCGQLRPVTNLDLDIGIYIVHLIKDHPEVIRQAQEVGYEFLPIEFDWTSYEVPV